MAYTLQFCQDGQDITATPLYAEEDADEARVWVDGADEPVCFHHDPAGWSFSDQFAEDSGYRTLAAAMDSYRAKVPGCGF